MLTPLKGRYLSFEEREDIALLNAQGAGVREIARALRRDPLTISRELRRNAATRGGKLDYRASVAQWKAELFAQRPKTARLVTNERLHQYVQDKLAGVVRAPNGRVVAGPGAPEWKGRNKPHRGDREWVTAWSPGQISNRIKADFPDDKSMRISHEAICQTLYVQGRGALKRELVLHLRTGRALRVPRARSKQQAWRMSPRRRSSASALLRSPIAPFPAIGNLNAVVKQPGRGLRWPAPGKRCGRGAWPRGR
jgi:IS30 family transposase